MTPPNYNIVQINQILRNVGLGSVQPEMIPDDGLDTTGVERLLAERGIDVSCGGCMAAAFTGHDADPHTCGDLGPMLTEFPTVPGWYLEVSSSGPRPWSATDIGPRVVWADGSATRSTGTGPGVWRRLPDRSVAGMHALWVTIAGPLWVQDLQAKQYKYIPKMPIAHQDIVQWALDNGFITDEGAHWRVV